MKNTLPLTGSCHFCGAPCKHRFCNRGHNAMYLMYKKRGAVMPKYDAPAETLQERIDRVVAKAEAEGTTGWARLA